MNRPLVTIITPTYKHETYIGECIESVLAQTYDNWEQIIVDDCSPDRTFEIAQRYRDPRIRAIRKPVRGGPSDLHASYNTALKMARGELIAVLEGDDYWPHDKLKIQVPYHIKRNISLSWGSYNMKKGTVLLGVKGQHSRSPIVFPDTSYLLIRNIIPALTVLASTAALRQIGGFWQPKGTVFVDHPTWLKLSCIGDILFVPQLLGIYRLHGGQISQTHQNSMCAFNHDYIAEFMDSLSPEQRQRLALKKIEASRSLYKASILQSKREYWPFLQKLAFAFFFGDARTKHQCIQNLIAIGRGSH